jgi:DNA-binding NarL/FixJ family response regulator
MGESILVVDDHQGFRSSARELLEAEGFEVVGEAVDAASGIEATRTLHPDIVLLDVQLPDVDGIEASAQISAVNGETVIVLISACDPVDFSRALLESPAVGFIPKSELSGDALRELVAKARPRSPNG